MRKYVFIGILVNTFLTLSVAQDYSDTQSKLDKIYMHQQHGKIVESFTLIKELFSEIDLMKNPFGRTVLNLLFEYSKQQNQTYESLYYNVIHKKVKNLNDSLLQKSTNNTIKIFLCLKHIAEENYIEAENNLKSINFSFSDDIYVFLIEKNLIAYNYESADRLYRNLKIIKYKELLFNLVIQTKKTSYANAIKILKKDFENIPLQRDQVNANIISLFINNNIPIKVLNNIKSLKLIDINDQLCKANFYIGFKFLNEGKQLMANKYFTESISYGTPKLIVYHLAQKYLENSTKIDNNIDSNTKTIAVLSLDQNGFSESDAQVASTILTSYLIKRNRFIVIERAKMEEILVEQGFQQSGCVSDECVIEAGNLLGVELMLAGSINRFGDLNLIDLRIVNVSNGKIVRSSSHHFEGKKELIISEGLDSALNQLLN